MKRFALRLLLAAGLAVLVLAALAAWIAGTQSGARFAARQADAFLPYDVEIESLEGRLAGPLVLGGLVLGDEGVTIEIERLRLDWRPRSLLDGTLDVERFDVSGVDVSRHAVDEGGARAAAEPPLAGGMDPPIRVVVGRASAEDVRYRPASGDAVRVDSAQLAGHWHDDELLLDELEARGPRFEIRGRARVVPAEPYATEARFEWSLEPPGYAEAVGTTEISGDLRRLRIEQRIEAPYNASVDAEVAEPLAALTLDGRVDLDVDLTELGAGLPAATLTATLRLDGNPDALEIGADAQLGVPDVGPVALSLDAALRDDRLAVETLGAVHAASGAELEVTGEATLGASPEFDLESTWTGLRWPLTGDALVASRAGSLRVAGRARDYDVELDGELTARAGAQVPETSGRVSVAGRGDRESLQLGQIEIEALRGRLEGTAELSRAPFGADLELTASDLDPAALAERWPGRIGGRLGASGGLDEDGRLRVQLDELSLDGRLRDRDVELTARGAYDNATLRLETLSLESGTTTIEAGGRVGDDADLELSVDSGDLGDVWPGASGRATLDGRLSGPAARPAVVVDASAQAVDVPGARIETLTLSADVDAAGEQASRVEASLEQAVVAGTEVRALELAGSGDAASHELTLSAAGPAGEGRLALTGAVERLWQPDAVWRFELAEARLDPAALGAWELQSASSGRIGAGQAGLDETCWRSADAELCLDGERTPERTTASLALSALPFAYVAGLLPAPVQLEGELSADGELVVTGDGDPRLELDVESTPARVGSASGGDGIELGPLEGRLTASADGFDARVSLPVADQGRLEATARVGAGGPDTALSERGLEGSVMARLEALELVSRLSTRVAEARGSLDGELELSGTLGAPRVSGTLALADASAMLPGPNVRLENVTLELSGDGTDLAVEAHAESGGGSLDAEGRLRPSATGLEGELSATGERFELANTLDLELFVSPDLELSAGPDRIDLMGSVDVPRAMIRARDADAEAVSVSRDEVVVGRGEGESGAAGGLRPVHATVMLTLGDDVEIDALGLTGSLTGGVEVTEVPGEPRTASGELRVENGTYEAYGQELEIRTGRLLFAGGPIERPGLDIEAVRRPAEDVLVGARVRGTLEQPELSVFSDPSMEQREQLSYLVLGRPLDSTSSAEESAVSRAALALGLRGGNFVSDRINENLGLDEFGVQTDPGDPASTASFVIGKYLAPSLYVSYGIGLFEPVSRLELRYEISRRWQLVTESSEEGSGGDIIYNIERTSRQ